MSEEPTPVSNQEEVAEDEAFALPEVVTEPCQLFLFSEAHVLRFVQDFVKIAQNQDELRKLLLHILHEQWKRDVATPEEAAASNFEQIVEEAIDRNSTAAALVERNGQLLLQVMLTRSVDNFLAYLGELLALIYRTSPKRLSASQQTETLEFILSYDTLDELHAAIAEKHVEEVTRGGGMNKLADDFKRRLRLTLFASADDLARATRIIALRNLFVHKRGRVDRFFLAQVRDSLWKLGEQVQLTVASVQADQEFLGRAGIDIDQRAVAKFDLPTIPIVQPTQADDTPSNTKAGQEDEQTSRDEPPR